MDLPKIRTLIDEARYVDAEKAALGAVARLESDPARVQELAEALDLVLEARRRGRRLSSTTGSVDFAERALRIKEAAFGPDDLRVADTLLLLGLARASARNAAGGRAAIERALAIRERVLGPDRLEVAAALNALGVVLRGAGEMAPAIEVTERGLALARRLEQPPGRETAAALTALASMARSQQDIERSTRLYEEALAIEERLFGPDHPALASTVSSLSASLRDLGDADGARAMQERCVRLLEAAPSADSRLAFELIELSTMADAAGEYADALAIAERAVTVAARATGPRSTLTAAAMGFKGSVLDRLGDHNGAIALRLQVVELWIAAQGPDSVHAAMALNGLAEAYEQAGRLDEAVAAVDRALSFASLAKQPSDYSRVLQTKARLLAAQGRRADARALLERARDVAAGAAFVVARLEVPMALTELARLERADGQPARALAYYREAIRLLEAELGPHNIRIASRRVELAETLAEIGALDEARAALLEGEARSLDHLRLIARTLSDRRALQFAAERQSGLDLAMTLATARKHPSPTDIEFAWQMLIHGRTVVLDEMAARQRTVAAEAGNPTVRERWSTLTRVRTRLANMIVRGPVGETAEQYQAQVDRARAARDQAERALAEASLAFRAEQRRAQASVREVIAQVPARSALVAFVRYTPHRLSPATPQHGHADVVNATNGPSGQTTATAAGAPESGRRGVGIQAPAQRGAAYAAFVARAGMTPRVVPLGPADVIDEAIAQWRERIQAELKSAGLATRRSEAAYRRAGDALRRLLWDPLKPHLGPLTSVFIVPDGAVHLVDVATLPTDAAGYLVETTSVHYLLAERDLVQPQTAPQGRSLLAVGAPDFDRVDRAAADPAALQIARNDATPPVLPPLRQTRSSCAALASRRFDPLPATRDEMQHIAQLWRQGVGMAAEGRSTRAGSASARPRAATSREGSLDDVLLLGDDRATETAFKVLAPGRRVLHLATHGFFLDRSCAAAAPDAEAQDGKRLLLESPLLRSGLVLAGANRHAQSSSAPAEEDDGILTAEEIAGLDLSAAQWAVLSACDTGRGDWQAGEGVLGLRRAFQVAGARTVILSLWPVIDQVASQWMAELYRGRFVQGVSTSAAVRAASRRLLAQRRAEGQSTHPLYWSGFIATGDWR